MKWQTQTLFLFHGKQYLIPSPKPKSTKQKSSSSKTRNSPTIPKTLSRVDSPVSSFPHRFNLLPTRYDLPDSTWDSPAIQITKGTDLCGQILEWQAIKRSGYQALQPLFANFPALFQPEVHSYSLFCWAADTVRSRSFEVAPQTPALIPLADMFNMPDIDLPHTPTSAHQMVNGSFQLLTLCDYDANSQILIHYGFKSNTEFLLHYGIIVYNNPFDSVRLYLSSELLPRDFEVDLKTELGIIDFKKHGFLLSLTPLPSKDHLFLKLCHLIAKNTSKSVIHYIDSILSSAIRFCEDPLPKATSQIEDDEEIQTAIWYVKSQRNLLSRWKAHAINLLTGKAYLSSNQTE